MHRHARVIPIFFFCFFIGVFVLFLLGFGISAHAQTIPGQTTGLTLIPEPSFPPPHTETIVSIDDYSLDTVGSTISWFINDVEQLKNKNERSLKIMTGNIGESTNIRVVLSKVGAPPLFTVLTLTPSQVDIILEATTHVPEFYKGRALASRDSMMRAVAVVNDGSKTPDASYVYKWSLDSTVLLGGQVTGKRVLDIAMPHYDDVDLFVEVFKTTGELIGQGAVALHAIEPELHFYEYSPLRGLSLREMSSPFRLTGDETTLYGEPYFIDSPMNENAANFSWKIDYEPASHEASIPNAITLSHKGGTGESTLEFSVETKKTFLQFVSQTLQLIF